MKSLNLFCLFIFFYALTGSSPVSGKQFITIGTGGVTGVYYPTGGAISKMVNNKYKKYHIKATVESTAGSVYNINAVLSKNLEFGIVQSDRQYQAYYGMAEWSKKGPKKKLRSVFSIHSESITLVASASSGIQKVSDIKNKRVNLGNPGSGQLQNAKDVLQAFGIDLSNIKPEYAKAIEAPGLLQDEKIDAFFYTVGHPAGAIKEATSGRIKVNIIPIKGKCIEKLCGKFPYYTKVIIPGAYYPNTIIKKDVESIGVKATLVTHSQLDEKIVYAITKEVFENFDAFKKLHPSYFSLTKKKMFEGLSAPIHKGALKYYKENGLTKFISPNLN